MKYLISLAVILFAGPAAQACDSCDSLVQQRVVLRSTFVDVPPHYAAPQAIFAAPQAIFAAPYYAALSAVLIEPSFAGVRQRTVIRQGSQLGFRRQRSSLRSASRFLAPRRSSSSRQRTIIRSCR